jgi:5-methylcytosine-specific restriction endonuclease McrA
MVRKAEKTARKKAGIPKPYNSGQWTEARYHSFVKGALRAASRRWPPKYEALRRACVGKRHDPATGKQSFRYTCAGCANIFKAAKISVDHIWPVVDTEEGFTSWDDIICRMFCEVDGLQTLCHTCHSIKTANERKARIEAKSRHSES